MNELNLKQNEYVLVKDNEGNYIIVFSEFPNAKSALEIKEDLKAKNPELNNIHFSYDLEQNIDISKTEEITRGYVKELNLKQNEYAVVKDNEGNYIIVFNEFPNAKSALEIKEELEVKNPELNNIQFSYELEKNIDISKIEEITRGYVREDKQVFSSKIKPNPIQEPLKEPMPAPELTRPIQLPKTSENQNIIEGVNFTLDSFGNITGVNTERTPKADTTEFMPVDIKEYVTEGLDAGILNPIYAKKTAPTHLVQGEEGTNVTSWVENEDGTPRIEREGIVQKDEETGGLGWIATKVDSKGNPVIDRNGHMNQWIIKDSVFRRTYEPSNLGNDLYIKSEVQTLVQIPDNIVFKNKYGEVMNVAAGGYINITNYERMYGISERDFKDTHEIIEMQNTENIENTNGRSR